MRFWFELHGPLCAKGRVRMVLRELSFWTFCRLGVLLRALCCWLRAPSPHFVLSAGRRTEGADTFLGLDSIWLNSTPWVFLHFVKPASPIFTKLILS